MEQQPKKVLRVHPAPPTSLTQEIPTPDIVHTYEEPPHGAVNSAANAFAQKGQDDVLSDVLGSYTGTPVDGGIPEQDADDL